MLPAFVTPAVVLPENAICPPAMYMRVLRSSVEAVSPATSTTEPRPNTMPLALMRKTWPLEVSVPLSSEGPPSSTRFSVAEVASGTMNCVFSPLAMLKVLQSMTARSVC